MHPNLYVEGALAASSVSFSIFYPIRSIYAGRSTSTGDGPIYADNRDHEALFSFIPKKEEIGHCSIPIWTMLKKCVETASG